jgi:hypothetical protein
MADINEAVAVAMLEAYSERFPEGSTLELRAGDSVAAVVMLPANPWVIVGRALDVQGGWSGIAQADGMVDNYRLSSGDHEDTGTVGKPDSDADMRMDNPNLAKGQGVFVNAFRKEI